MTDPRATVTGIHTIGVPVTDQDAATAFYRDVLGFEVRADVHIDELGSRWTELAPAGSPVTVALVRADENDPAGREVGIRFTTPDAAALHARFTAEGVDVDELLTWPGVPPMFVFRDRDGNGLEIVEAS
ncbi:hypothetical protein Ae168Ps1_2059c [Pseudonocardia sp. Ae168_Ps1]|uniref:VOC family protein n=1 Tax=unclassified Pseudonocardia TaxID=2619320 RepID=UPI00094ACF44|nr:MULTISPECIES: VOC family protein [unclassified Pseudonocardia]OLL73676.1 hypothetical protein Ae150APs1_2054c [Pseudonocardia sp. Ae150A_Ps1]OLL79653.1 hypothetical protein Ae168Ps1_2059c [Pseudonocardia sp. Ae168_Ps1]OLL86210.1 hypothetical protein Ae263Ps1_3265 [Pseudonocardia sp. Ae263_Ps1]OLL93759.1 hypothetical protein Ae356Ps1_3656c [Pseudonocardia sp. Ae356_Ps1]